MHCQADHARAVDRHPSSDGEAWGNYMKMRFLVPASVLIIWSYAGHASAAAAYGPTPSDSASGSSSDMLTEVVVTAQKREERLKDVPISIVAVTADELRDRQITSLEDVP